MSVWFRLADKFVFLLHLLVWIMNYLTGTKTLSFVMRLGFSLNHHGNINTLVSLSGSHHLLLLSILSCRGLKAPKTLQSTHTGTIYIFTYVLHIIPDCCRL